VKDLEMKGFHLNLSCGTVRDAEQYTPGPETFQNMIDIAGGEREQERLSKI